MTLRVGFDMDGVVADFASAFRDIERDLFGADTTDPAPNAPEEEKEQTPDRNPNPAVSAERERPPSSRRLGPHSRDTRLLDDAEADRSRRGGTAARADAAVRVGSGLHHAAAIDGR